MTETTGRELTADELDVEAGLDELMLLSGSAWQALESCISDERWTEADREHRRRIADTYWRSIPLRKALAQLARECPARLQFLWAKELRGPMPFGMPRKQERTR